ncbi:DEKNAAC104428 [Brettanomyces naardenensis]|uniref:DEKNAAC104428 n=1 Tax=Brettanomyces naardenensis TaxID=13370 RepID=A0A448YQV7_BRENA|nr:DEKNAAC104428 [Brettanomyces naardenensis]
MSNHSEPIDADSTQEPHPQEKAPVELPDGGANNYLRLKDVTPKLEKYWFQYPYLLKLNILILGGVFAQVVSGYDGSLLNGMQSLDVWQNYFNTPQGAMLGTITNGLTIGTLISTPFVWILCERIGRRRSLIIGCLTIVLGGFIQAFATSTGMFVGGRIIIGIGGCLSQTAASPLVAECSYPPQRPIMTALLLVWWNLGSFVAALVTWGPYNGGLRTNNWAWRLPSLLQIFFPCCQIVLGYFGPESPRWLVDKNREDEALEMLAKYHANGDTSSPLVLYEMGEIRAAVELEKESKSSSWLEWFKSKQMFHRFFICCAVPAIWQLCGNALVSYYLHLVLDTVGLTDSVEQLKINLGLTVWTLFCGTLYSMVVDKFPRRSVLFVGFSTSCLTFVIWTILSALSEKGDYKNKGLAAGVVTMIYLFNTANTINVPIAVTYVMEIAPYNMRAKASTLYQLWGNVAGLFNNYVNPIGLANIHWKYYIVWPVWILVHITVVYFFFPETYGLSLEEVDEVFMSKEEIAARNQKQAEIIEDSNFEKKEQTEQID